MPGTRSGQAVLRCSSHEACGEEKAEDRDGDLGGAGEEGEKLDLFLLLRRDVSARCPRREQPMLGQSLPCSAPVLW